METIYVTKTKIWVFYLVVSCFFRKFASKNKFMKVPKKILNFVSENLGSAYSEDFALRVPPFHSRGTVRLTLMVPSISERWYWYQASEMSAVKRCSITDVA